MGKAVVDSVPALSAADEVVRRVEARIAITEVLDSLLRCLPREHQERPTGSPFMSIVDFEGSGLCDAADLVAEVARRVGATPDQARSLIRAVFAGLDQVSPGVAEYLLAQLNAGVLDLLTGEIHRGNG
ncbi:DUF2267 domain-containing protein [Amycolatopsis anabasis]|uniref:DUF2267 domain-containing protein n=1 Tax=Amycolatopsis anabasis TaxID=1840409 RepID=UPI00131B3110|nr:DUF2267 domain-containing protein [Amycolatopsis anabasis]